MIKQDRLLEIMGVRDQPGIYVVGVNEQRVTFYAQQCRALNLVYKLADRGSLRGFRVAVIGGGVSGTTAASAAARLGARVSLLEKLDRPLAIQAGCSSRWVHPHLYDWPASGWDNANAGLPIMNWTAAPAGDVVRQLRSAWSAHVSTYSIREYTRCFETSIEPVPNSADWRVSWNSRGWKSERFDVVILAVGFGLETERPYTRSYWKDDDLHQEPLVKTIVSGCGDGGLTDVLRLALTDFRHEELVEFASGRWLDGIREDVIAVERDEGDLGRLNEYYATLKLPRLRSSLRTRLRNLSQVTLNGSTGLPFDRRSSALNRLLVGQLMQLGLDYIPGRLEVRIADNASSVVIDRGPQDSREYKFDRVVVRHGPDSPTPVNSFPNVARNLRLSRDIIDGLPVAADQSRFPTWPASAFVDQPRRPERPAS